METVRAKIGATFLDVAQPGWAERINLRRLDLNSCESCVLGQLFGDFANGAEKVFAMRGSARFAAARECGLDGAHDGPTDQYTALTAAWKREIAKRLRAAGGK